MSSKIRYALSALIFTLTNVFILTTYYLGGGEFERGFPFGFTFAVSIVAGIVLSSYFLDLSKKVKR